jgi:hypothetical protein
MTLEADLLLDRRRLKRAATLSEKIHLPCGVEARGRRRLRILPTRIEP